MKLKLNHETQIKGGPNLSSLKPTPQARGVLSAEIQTSFGDNKTGQRGVLRLNSSMNNIKKLAKNKPKASWLHEGNNNIKCQVSYPEAVIKNDIRRLQWHKRRLHVVTSS